MSIKRALLFVMLFGSVATTAIAQSTATATLSNIRYTLTDLDLTDGIAPSLTFRWAGPATVMWQVNNYYWHDNDLGELGEPLSLNHTHAPAPPERVGDRVEMSAIREGNSLSTLNLNASVSAISSIGPIQGTAQADGGLLVFTLSPNTSISMFFDTNITASVGPSASTAFQPTASGDIYVTLATYDPLVGNTKRLTEAAHGVGSEIDRSETLVHQLDNPFSSEKHFEVFASVSATALSTIVAPVPEVPEPGTYAMMLAGLGILAGSVARQRRQHDGTV